MIKHLTLTDLETGLDLIRRSPKDDGVLELIVRRPRVDEREVLQDAELDLELGLIGDNWKTRGSSRTTDGFGHPDMQLTIMNARFAALIAQVKERWPLAGDQLYLDLDLSDGNLPPCSRIALGEAVIEVTKIPHTGCKKFAERFGVAAVKFANSPVGKELHLRGINAKVVKPGVIRVGDRTKQLIVAD